MVLCRTTPPFTVNLPPVSLLSMPEVEYATLRFIAVGGVYVVQRELKVGYSAKGWQWLGLRLLYANHANDGAFRVERDWGIKLPRRCYHNPPNFARSLLHNLPISIFIFVSVFLFLFLSIFFILPRPSPTRSALRPSCFIPLNNIFRPLYIWGRWTNTSISKKERERERTGSFSC